MSNRTLLLSGLFALSGCLQAPVGESESAICVVPPDCDSCHVPSGCSCVPVTCHALPNETATCDTLTGSCINQCKAGFGDCDGASANGCEKSLTADVNNCGACGHVCSAPGGSQATCTNGVCGVSCDGVTTHFCNGTCIPISACCGDGDCKPPMNGYAVCVNHTCYAACKDASVPICGG